MPKIEVTREQLEDLIEATMYLRTDLTLEPDTSQRLLDLHIKLEDTLDLWINGGEVTVPAPENLRKLGACSITYVHPPHDEGVVKND